MNRTIPLLCVIFIAMSLALSGCIDPNIPDIDQSGSTPTDYKDVPTPTPTQTPIPPRMQFSDDVEPTPTPEPENKSTWDVCDPRHNESWLYMHKCGMYSSGGSGGSASEPQSVVPELATIIALVCGILLLAMLCRRK